LITVKINDNTITISDDRNTPFIDEVVITKEELKLINKKVRLLKSHKKDGKNKN